MVLILRRSVVNTQDFKSGFVDIIFNEIRSDKAGASGDEDTLPSLRAA
jgi:hypothetical protein